MPSKLLLEVADYCWSKNFLDVFRQFFADHGAAFEGAPLALVGGEHNLEYYNLFQVYLKLYESTLVNYLKTLDCTIEEFYRDVRDAQHETTDPYLQTFIDCLLASADYDSFYKVMAKEGAKSLAKKKMMTSTSTKAESKSSGGGGDSKMTDRNEMKRGSCAEGRDEDDFDDTADYKSNRK